jgi:hypothetical protein
MKEKILALLLAKCPGVRKDGLAQLAASLSLQVADETEATALIERLTVEKVNDFVKDWRKEVDKEVSEGNKTFEKTLKSKYDLVEKKEPEPGKDPKPADPNDIATIVANAVKAAVEPLQKELSSFKGEKTTETRLQQITGKLVNVPEAYKNQQIEYNKLIVGSMTDEQFAAHLTKVDSDIAAFNQELADKGLAGQGKPFMGGKGADGVSSSVASFIKEKTEPSKTLVGKEV